MRLKRLSIHHFRNITEARLELSPGINLVYGHNGSGKTSLLEAAYFLGMARSFRTPRLSPIVEHDHQAVTVRGELADQPVSMGVSRSKDGQRTCRINGEDVGELSRLTRLMPTVLMGPETSNLVSGPPDGRRRFLNWGVFHVERGFEAIWRNYSRCLKQRNQVLKQRSTAVEVWDKELCRWGEQVDHRRSRYFCEYQGVLADVCRLVMPGFRIDCSYLRGWPEDRDLLSQLETDQSRDQDRGQTHRGPHRADIQVHVNGQHAATECSRGELKTLAWCMLMAQGKLQQDQQVDVGQSTPIYLVDDLLSELDGDFSSRIARLLTERGAQVIATGIESEQLRALFPLRGESLMFHVKQGAFDRVNE